ncbi:reticulocyte-binding protein homolog 2a-like [Battus philenor]|uniref:reticulocyte-binding protein homolog 2a-like n=1 Tax=Battus philenor TaxID=42288 RepID=UPI0035CEA457
MKMDIDNNISFVRQILENSNELNAHEDCLESCNNSSHSYDQNGHEEGSSYNTEKHSAVWTTDATLTLLKLYENKLEMLETPKKKTRIWMAISESLKNYNIEMTSDQVRWKINALTKKYKQCIDSGQHEKFKYFKEMDSIYSKFNVDNDAYTIAELLQKKKECEKDQTNAALNQNVGFKSGHESKTMIELRKVRLASRIESDTSQSKIHLENQWLEYLKRQEEQKHTRDEMLDRDLELREEELELRKRAIEIKNSIDLRKMEMWERKQETLLSIEREKFEMLKKFFSKN